MRLVALLFTGSVVAFAASGCTVDVLLGFQQCEVNGVTYEPGTGSIPDEDGCKRCECTAEGTLACNASLCTCDFEGVLREEGTTFAAADGCNTCQCHPDGTVECTTMACPPPCQDPPMCAQSLVIGCVVDPICNPDGSWTCMETCECGGSNVVPECPPPPTGCYFTGPYCDGQQWTCGDLICDGCQSQPDACMDPGIPGCWAEPWCDGFNWTCIVNCDPCLMEAPPDCVPMSADCAAYPYCDPMYGWQCYEECATPGCPDPPPVCETMDPMCIVQPVCLDGAWYCEIAC